MRPLTRRHLLAALAAAAAARALPARAETARAAQLSAQDAAALGQVQQYLDGIRTLRSRFQQYAQDGGVAAGTIYLQRPGKMRIVYDPPTPILIVSDGRAVYYWDSKLEQLSQIGVEDTPAWFLLRPEIKLSGDVTVTGFRHEPGVLRIAMAETKSPDQGSLTLVMSERPFELKQWTVVDPQQRQVTVMLESPEYGVALDPNLFFWTRQTSGPSSH
ncbi:MAG TPA: outer membrane lipoprotein carrier protein LolA [Stellaceae bacterium]|nr:outer membrane lipoprotein carrier protein LolA [Stellaceae bacterium]